MMFTFIPVGVEISPHYQKIEVQLQSWINNKGVIDEDAPSFIVDMHEELMEEIDIVIDEVGVIY